MTTNNKLKYHIDVLLQDAYATRINNVPESINLAEKALKISKEVKDKALIGKSLNQLSLYYMISSHFEKSTLVSKEAINYFEALNDQQGIADANYNIGSIYYKTTNYHLGLAHLVEALKIYREFKDYHKQSKVEKAVGTIYGYICDDSNAFSSFKRAIKIARKVNDKNAESNVLTLCQDYF